MAEESLPHRTVAYRFPKVPDFTDPEYEKSNPEHFILARDQRMREYHVNYVYMLRLQQTLRLCILQSGINSKRECHDLGAEYMRRISCPNYSCPDDSNYLAPAPLADYRFGAIDDSLEREWKTNKIFSLDDQ